MLEVRVKKRIFLGLALGALLLAGALLSIFWYLSSTGAYALLYRSLTAAGWAAVFVVICVLAGIALMIASLFSSKSLGILSPFAFKMIDFAYPLALGLAKALRFDTDLVRRSYVEVHNQATKFCIAEKQIEKIMILAPHCLQKSECPHKITIDINNCKRCGKCPVDGLISVADVFGAKLSIATGGTLARDVVIKYRPDAVVAIACERDLISGIQDVMPLTVLGVLNQRPNGPCHNTKVSFSQVEGALRNLLGKRPISRVKPSSFTSQYN